MRFKLSQMYRFVLFGVIATVFPLLAIAQTEPIEGIRQSPPGLFVLRNATVVPQPGETIMGATIVIRDGVFESVGTDVKTPDGAQVIDYSGYHIYPGFVEPYQPVEQPRKVGKVPRNLAHWNKKVHPEADVLALLSGSSESRKKWHEMGFTSALFVPKSGIFKGKSAVISLRKGEIKSRLLNSSVAQHLEWEHGGWGDRSYPSSLMGAIALTRQTLSDAAWYERATDSGAENLTPEQLPVNHALSSLFPVMRGEVPLLFHADNDLDIFRFTSLIGEYQIQPIILGSGYEYRQTVRVAELDIPFILPVNFPEAPDVSDPDYVVDISLRSLRHWDRAPENPARLDRANVQFSLTHRGIESAAEFHKQIRTSIRRGLSAQTALAALTTTPAKMLGLGDKLGKIQAGYLAHLVVSRDAIFTKDWTVHDLWVDGHRIAIKETPPFSVTGKWRLNYQAQDSLLPQIMVQVGGDYPHYSGSAGTDSFRTSLRSARFSQDSFVFAFHGDTLGVTGVLRFQAFSGDEGPGRLTGTVLLPDGTTLPWSATRIPESESETASPSPELHTTEELPPLPPVSAFGASSIPAQPDVLFVQDVTLWTSAPQGVLHNGDMLIRRGTIKKIGTDLSPPGDALVIRGDNLHVTAGLIDAHSHTGIDGGVNESTQAVTSEVRITDVIDPYDIAFYRELAGGLTTSHELHGSANPIGGQNAIIKLRWGGTAEQMIMEEATPTIKFALGENVKQANWGERFTTRYPQTRMGVEQLIRDRFKATLDYEQSKKSGVGRQWGGNGLPVRTDYELEALLEILTGDRIIHSHSYRQDEILMLMRLAEEFDFRIGTLQHILEGYKVADIMAEHGAAASTFSDWWAYKFEVYDAIPYNGALMHDAGVLVSFNSDSDELSRRLNTEAAKAMKYGGVSKEEALKFVTINPAKQLHLAHRIGSLEEGKDADFVVWNNPPLSSYAVCQQTWIDGRKYFDREADQQGRNQIKNERNQLVQKALETISESQSTGGNSK